MAVWVEAQENKLLRCAVTLCTGPNGSQDHMDPFLLMVPKSQQFPVALRDLLVSFSVRLCLDRTGLDLDFSCGFLHSILSLCVEVFSKTCSLL